MMAPETMLTIGTTVVSTIVIIATGRNDIRWLKRWTREHDKQDSARFKDHSDQIETLTRAMLNSHRSS